MLLREEPRGDFKQNCKHWLQDTMANMEEGLNKAQVSYKNIHDARLRKKTEVINVEDYVYIGVESKGPDEHRHKLAAIAEGP